MSNPDDSIDQALDDMFSAGESNTPDDNARRRAIAMARAEFESVQAEKSVATEKRPQGLLGWLRPIVNRHDDNGRSIMSLNQKFAYSGMGAIAVGALAVGLTLQNQTQLEPGPYTSQPGAGGRVSGDDQAAEREAQGSRIEEVVASADSATRSDQEVSIALGNVVPSPAQEPRKESTSKFKAAAPTPQRQDGQPSVATAATGTPPTSALYDRMARARTGEAVPSSLGAAPAREVRRMGIVADMDAPAPQGYKDVGRDKFEAFEENRVTLVTEAPVSTFSADVDTASYSFVRRMLNNGVLPQGDAVRAEELINYFDYSYTVPDTREQPFAPTVVITDAPWAEGRKLMHIGIKGYDVAPHETPRSNLVFLLDVSGSMNSPDKLPLVKQSMELLLTTMKPDDTVAIAVYAGAAGVVLEPTRVAEKQKILDAMRNLSAGGSTAGAQGIRLAYELAAANLDGEAVNRVILATDGDFNVGITDQRELKSFIERKRDEGIFLSVLGFGQGNYRDALMQTLAQNGNGVAAYIDTLGEAQKVLVEEATSTLFPIARDVKFQVEFNPAAVAEYRLIGYETRHLNREDFNNDAVDAGDVGAGHTVTALYEFTPVGSDARYIEESRYRQDAPVPDGTASEYAFLKIRYKLPEEDSSRLITRAITAQDKAALDGDTGFAAAVAGFAQVLKGGKYTGEYDYDDVIGLALKTRGDDPYGYRSEFVQLARKAKSAAAMQRR